MRRRRVGGGYDVGGVVHWVHGDVHLWRSLVSRDGHGNRRLRELADIPVPRRASKRGGLPQGASMSAPVAAARPRENG
jgi:hypothetical protein